MSRLPDGEAFLLVLLAFFRCNFHGTKSQIFERWMHSSGIAFRAIDFWGSLILLVVLGYRRGGILWPGS